MAYKKITTHPSEEIVKTGTIEESVESEIQPEEESIQEIIEPPIVAEITEPPAIKVKKKSTRAGNISEPPAIDVAIEPAVAGEITDIPALDVVTDVPVAIEISELPAIDVVMELPVIVAPADTNFLETEAVPGEPNIMMDVGMHGAEDEEEGEEEVFTAETNEEELNNINDFPKERLVELLEETVKETDINKIKTRVALLKVAYLRLSKDDKEHHLDKYTREGDESSEARIPEDPLDQRFDQAFESYKLNKAKYIDEQEQVKQKNLAEKHNILDELKVLINSEETLKKTYDHFRILQDKWKEIGMVPKSEVNNLWQNYHFLVEKFFDKVKINRELKDLDLKKNLEAKIKLCEKAEELLLETSIIRSFKQLQKYHEEWKEIGPVVQDKKDEIWERFKTTTDKINERRRDHYKKLQEEQQDNYLAKLALCEKAEQIVAARNNSLNEWQNATDEMSDLLKVWRSIGQANKKMNDKIWERFKTSLDAYFSEKKEYFNKVKEQQVHNYNLKLDLCVQAEALKNNTDWRNTTQDLINLQKEWKEIGPVPRKHANRIWKRFRAACDEFFTSKATYFSSIQKQEEENLQMKLDLIKKVQDYQVSGDKNEDLRIIKEMQREWMDIGHVPMKEKDRLQNEFRTAINKHLDKLKIDAVEISTLNFKARYESVRDYPDANRILSKERGSILSRISKLREDISLWENNIGFLADSKNAQLLKKEFEKKIDNAKNDLIILEAKMKILAGQRS